MIWKLSGGLALLATGLLVAYFLAEPSRHQARDRANAFHAAAMKGGSLAGAIAASPKFTSVIFGNCGHLDPSPDSGPKGSLIFSPAQGPFARYSNFAEFVRLNPKLFQDNVECRSVAVQYMPIFPYRGVVGLEIDGEGNILTVRDPLFGF